MRSLRLAIGFLTLVPVAPAHAGTMAPARAYFPLVGLGIGGLLAGLDIAARQVLPLPVVGALLVAALLVLTRALHTEGFLDTCDGLLGGRDRESRLAILRDSHVGAFAAIGGACLLLLKWTLLAGIPEAERLGLLVLFACFSRFAMVAAMFVFPYARTQGLGSAFHDGASWRQFAAALADRCPSGGTVARDRRAAVAGGRDGRCSRTRTLVQTTDWWHDGRHVRRDQRDGGGIGPAGRAYPDSVVAGAYRRTVLVGAQTWAPGISCDTAKPSGIERAGCKGTWVCR